MFDFLIRFAPLAVGVVFGFMSVGSWTSGAPPAWSLFGPKTAETVIESRVEEGRASNGSLRFVPIVTVATPDGPQQLEGLIPSFSTHDRVSAESAVAGYKVDQPALVRWVGAKPMADRVDLFGMAHAVAMTVFALLLLLGGGFWAWAMGRKPGTAAAT